MVASGFHEHGLADDCGVRQRGAAAQGGLGDGSGARQRRHGDITVYAQNSCLSAEL